MTENKKRLAHYYLSWSVKKGLSKLYFDIHLIIALVRKRTKKIKYLILAICSAQ